MTAPALALLWHLHQPQYRRRGDPGCFLPWVRLHAIRSYQDMVRVLDAFPDVHVTINFAPCLVEEIQAYVDGASDAFLDVARRPTESLGESERRFLVEHFFSADPHQMIGPLPRYRELLEQRNAALATDGPERAHERFSAADLRDLVALFDLAWFGFTAREDYADVARLRAQGGGFDAADVARIHEVEREILAGLLGRYRAAIERGQLEVSASPAFHPILPLLVDTDSAREALPEAPLPPRATAPERARWHVERGLDILERAFGRRPVGMWPSEGSVSQPVAELLGECAVGWAASDQDVLARSETDRPADPYRAWRAGRPGAETTLVFRDHDLSDRVGFRYARMDPHEAAEDLLSTAAARLEAHGGGPERAVYVVLDGENPWNHFPEAGGPFLRALYGHLASGDRFRGRTVGEAVREAGATGHVRRVFPGSWIYANFGTWIGGPEKNRAWQLLSRTRARLAGALEDAGVAEEARDAASQALGAAEGSDWFWWLDGQFVTSHRDQFEGLFRGHLRDAHEALGVEPPDELAWTLLEPIADASDPRTRPFGWIDPTVNGFESDFFEWCGAARYPWADLALTSAMQTAEAPIRELRLGLSRDGDLCVRIDPVRGSAFPAFAGCRVTLSLRAEAQRARLEIDLDEHGDAARVSAESPDDAEGGGPRRDGLRVAARKILEIRVPGAAVGLWPGARAALRVELETASAVHELAEIPFDVPTSTFVEGLP